jgi:DNA helicase-2/ATP-dependent DNA helicase PcrA
MKLSIYQQEIANFVQSGKGNARVGAVAGSGKTFTLVSVIAKIILDLCQQGQFIAFGKEIAIELAKKLPSNLRAKTGHSMALSGVRKVHPKTRIDKYKYNDLIRDFIEHLPSASDELKDLVKDGVDLYSPLVDLCRFARLTLVDTSDHDELFDMAMHYNIDLPEEIEAMNYCFDSLPKILAVGRKEACYSIDFDDMIWLCATDSKMVPYQTQWVLVDECQDLSKAMLACIKKAGKRNARFIFVGDENQSINGFAGADCQSFQNISKSMEITDLPLSICYRCPTSHLDLAREIVPHIEARNDAPTGTIERCKESDLVDKLMEGDLLISRINAPLIKICFALIAQGKTARIKGRNIGDGLTATAKKLAKRKDFKGWNSFDQSVDQWCLREITKLLKAKNKDENLIQATQDKAECLKIIWIKSEATSLQSFKKAVDSLFAEDIEGIQLSSIHRAKGLESDRVFIYNPSLLPGPWCYPGSWQYEQEMNLKYVALTRSKDYLCFVDVPKKQIND